MKRVLAALGLFLLVVFCASPQTKSEASKQRQVLVLYEQFASVDHKLVQLEKRSDELEKELGSFLESDSALNRLSGVAMLVGAFKAWIPQMKDALTEENLVITKLVTTSTGLTGDAGRYADEGVRLLREQHVYLQQGIGLAEQLAKDMTQALRSIREDRLADLSEILNEGEFSAQLKAIGDLDQKQELARARAKDAFARLKASVK